MQIFFDNENTKDILSGCIKKISQIVHTNEFEEDRNGVVVMILKFMVTQSSHWDKDCQFNIPLVSQQLINLASKDSEYYQNGEQLNSLFVICFRFYSEFYLYQPHDNFDRYTEVRRFAKENTVKLSGIHGDQINYILTDMPTSILKSIISGHDLKTLSSFIETKEKAETLKEKWDEEITQKESKVNSLKTTLEGYETAFNFVALYAGFSSLGAAKSNELLWARRLMFSLASLIPILISVGLWHIIYSSGEIKSLYELIYLIPFVSLTLILIYYFRISLFNYNSIRAQIMQIELRKSLCQFIQDYARYSKEISESNSGLLNKFEEIIFSNIMTTEEKIPSTFDGLEQIASLIGAIKTKSK